MFITVLCKVVDNFGDIGVVWRLCHQLQTIQNTYEINLVVDDLEAFSKINNQIEISRSFQEINGISVYAWKDYAFCQEVFSENDGEKLNVILECFQCGRPDWMEKILFEEKLQRTVDIIMIDYLTAEKYAEDFHCLNSLTRSAKVRKVNFMPGFTEKTGGLTIDRNWKELKSRNRDGSVLVFTYERNWSPVVKALKEWLENKKQKVFVAQGRGFESFVEASRKECFTDKVTELSYLNQDEWDLMMQDCSALFIRGEESMSRACLSGIPFVWHAYPQSDEYQLVKVNVLLERMEKHFRPEDFTIVKDVWNVFNEPESRENDIKMYERSKKFLSSIDNLEYGFKDFAQDLRKNGDLAANLMTFIEKIAIMNK